MLERRTLAICFVFLLPHCFIQADMKVKFSCFGDEFKLECPLLHGLLVHLTSLSVRSDNSSLCSKGASHLAPCDLLSYSDAVKRQCSGKRSCVIERKTASGIGQKCNTKYIVTVLYECRSKNVTIYSKLPATTIGSISNGRLTTHMKTKPVGADNEVGEGRKVSSVTCLFYTLFSATMALQYMQDRPKHLILCFVLSISAGIVILMLAVLLMACIEKLTEGSKKKDNAAVEISLPLLIAPPNIPATSTQIESAHTSEDGSGQRDLTLPRIQSIRRCHSVDEGTQTEPDTNDVFSIDNGLSDNEAKELGYLVDIMRYYNSNLDSMNSPNEPFSVRVESPTESYSKDFATARTELAYTGPRIVDASRRRQPRLSSATYSSSNNSENGDAASFLSSTGQQQNHVNYANTPSISTLPRRRPYLNSKHNSPTPSPYSLHNNNSTRIPNGPRNRVAGRTRFAEQSQPDLERQYGTLG